MAFPRKLLIPGEQLVLELRPHPVALAFSALITFIVMAVGIWLISAFDFDWIVYAAILIALIAYPLRHLVSWLTSYFVVTSDRVIQREGWISKRSIEIPLEQINDIRFEQGVFERVIGAGDIHIRSASNDGPTTFRDIRHPEEVQRTVYHQAELNNQRMYHGGAATGAGLSPGAPVPQGAGVPPPAPVAAAPIRPDGSAPHAPSTTTELERLADLRARGVLTEEEFQAQKAKILGQG
ncbi:MAG TPA: PH domain-containing protein [Actinomycetota bacterium]